MEAQIINGTACHVAQTFTYVYYFIFTRRIVFTDTRYDVYQFSSFFALSRALRLTCFYARRRIIILYTHFRTKRLREKNPQRGFAESTAK